MPSATRPTLQTGDESEIRTHDTPIKRCAGLANQSLQPLSHPIILGADGRNRTDSQSRSFELRRFACLRTSAKLGTGEGNRTPKHFVLSEAALPICIHRHMVRCERLELSCHSLTSDSQPDASASSASSAHFNCQRTGARLPSRTGQEQICSLPTSRLSCRALVRGAGLEPADRTF